MIQKGTAQHYENESAVVSVFAEQSENCSVIAGKVTVQSKTALKPSKVSITLKGMYRIWKAETQTVGIADHSETLSNFDNECIDGKDGERLAVPFQLLREECFLQGRQEISQLSTNKSEKEAEPIFYPFLFDLPNRLPPSLQEIWFAGRRIEIKYFLIVSVIESETKATVIETQFDLTVRQLALHRDSESKLCKVLRFGCFTRFFCLCLGTYRIEMTATLLRPGKLQVEGRVLREGRAAEKIINDIEIVLMGELRNVKRMPIAQKKMVLHSNEFEMLEGEVLLTYSPDLKSVESQLITVRFWIDCIIEFKNNVWKIKKHETTTDIFL